MRAASALLAVAVAVAVAAALGVPTGAGAAKQPKRPATPCEKLAKRYKDRAPDRRLVLVVRGSDETGRISACLLPRGKVRTVASWDDGLARDAASIVATAGAWVLVEDFHSDQYGGRSRSLTRVDVRGGTRLLLSSFGCLFDYDQPGCPDGTDFGDAAIAPSGAGAYEAYDFATRTTTLRAFGVSGAMIRLADGPVDALRVTRTTAFWTQAGVAHAAPLP